MNEDLVKELIKYKLNTAGAIIDSLPPRISKEIKDLGRIILESANESFKEMEGQETKKPKPEDKLDNITIE